MSNYEDETILPLWNPAISYAKPECLPCRPFKPLPRVGSYESDRQKPDFNMLWPSYDVFTQWKKHQEETFSMRWVITNRDRSTDKRYLESVKYICNQSRTGGEKKYEKKNPEQVRKIPSRKLEDPCSASIFVKTYPGTPFVLGKYSEQHSHSLGNDNLRFNPLSHDARRGIKAMALEQRSTEHIVQLVRQGTFNILPPKQKQVLREELTTRRSVQYYLTQARANVDRLHKEDAKSVAEWVRKLAKTGSVLFFKGVTDPPPEGSRIELDAFILVLQSEWQREVWELIGPHYLGTDGTHNVTGYDKTNLYTMMARDEFGKGVPVAYMLASNGQQATHELYFRVFRASNPTLPPYIIMDRDLAAFNAARVIAVCSRVGSGKCGTANFAANSNIYSDVKVLLCLFHLVSAWWKHISVPKNGEVWGLALRLSRATTQEEFDSLWAAIKAKGPPRFVSYMEDTWLREPYLSAWTHIHRQNRTLLQQQDTTNIVESYHHVLKYMFFGGYLNRRLDTVIQTLMERLEDHYKTRRLRQDLGFEGEDLQKSKRREIEKQGLKIPNTDVKKSVAEEGQEAPEQSLLYDVRSQSNPTLFYLADIDTPLCSCPFFIKGGVEWCKHLAAARRVHEYGATFGGSRQEEPTESTKGAVGCAPAAGLSTEENEGGLAGEGEEVGGRTRDEIGKDPWWDGVASKLRFIGTMPLLQSLTIDEVEKGELTQVLNRLMDQILPRTATLPPKSRCLPHMLASTETALVLPKLRKKAARNQYGPYGMGEASGKKVKDKAPPSQAPGPSASSTSLAGPIPRSEAISLPVTMESTHSWNPEVPTSLKSISTLYDLPHPISHQSHHNFGSPPHDIRTVRPSEALASSSHSFSLSNPSPLPMRHSFTAPTSSDAHPSSISIANTQIPISVQPHYFVPSQESVESSNVSGGGSVPISLSQARDSFSSNYSTMSIPCWLPPNGSHLHPQVASRPVSHTKGTPNGGNLAHAMQPLHLCPPTPVVLPSHRHPMAYSTQTMHSYNAPHSSILPHLQLPSLPALQPPSPYFPGC